MRSSVLPPLPAGLAHLPVLLDEKTALGAVRIVGLSPSALLTQTAGHLDVRLAMRVGEATFRAITESPRPSCFLDWERMHNYDSRSRVLLTELVVKNASKFRDIVVLASSTAVAVGVSTAGLATVVVGVTLRGMSDRAAFDALVLAAAKP